MKKNRVISFVLVVAMLVSLINNIGGKLYAYAYDNNLSNSEADRTDEISELTENSTTYDLGNGLHEMQIYSSEVRYVDDETGEYVDYKPNLVKVNEEETELGESLVDYSYENEVGDKKHYFPEMISEDTPVISEYKNYQIEMAPLLSKENNVILDDDQEIEDLYGNVSEGTNSVIYEDVKRDIDVSFDSLENGIKEGII